MIMNGEPALGQLLALVPDLSEAKIRCGDGEAEAGYAWQLAENLPEKMLMMAVTAIDFELDGGAMDGGRVVFEI